MMLIVTLPSAVPLSRIDPRSVVLQRILPAVILYFVYLVSLNTVRGLLRVESTYRLNSNACAFGISLIALALIFFL